MLGLSLASKSVGDEETLLDVVLADANGRFLSESDLSLKGP